MYLLSQILNYIILVGITSIFKNIYHHGHQTNYNIHHNIVPIYSIDTISSERPGIPTVTMERNEAQTNTEPTRSAYSIDTVSSERPGLPKGNMERNGIPTVTMERNEAQTNTEPTRSAYSIDTVSSERPGLPKGNMERNESQTNTEPKTDIEQPIVTGHYSSHPAYSSDTVFTEQGFRKVTSCLNETVSCPSSNKVGCQVSESGGGDRLLIQRCSGQINEHEPEISHLTSERMNPPMRRIHHQTGSSLVNSDLYVIPEPTFSSLASFSSITPVSLQPEKMRDCIHPDSSSPMVVGQYRFFIVFISFLSVCLVTLIFEILYTTDKSHFREIDPGLLPLTAKAIKGPYVLSKWASARIFHPTFSRSHPSAKEVDLFQTTLLHLHTETTNALEDQLLKHLQGLSSRTNIFGLSSLKTISSIHDKVLSSSSTLTDEYLQNVLKFLKHPLRHETYWIDAVVDFIERKYEIRFPSVTDNFVRRIALHMYTPTFTIRMKRGMERAVGVVFYERIERKKRGRKNEFEEKHTVSVKKAIMVDRYTYSGNLVFKSEEMRAKIAGLKSSKPEFDDVSQSIRDCWESSDSPDEFSLKMKHLFLASQVCKSNICVPLS
jgi:hypothetical protein